jgi:hypothetical protein
VDVHHVEVVVHEVVQLGDFSGEYVVGTVEEDGVSFQVLADVGVDLRWGRGTSLQWY